MNEVEKLYENAGLSNMWVENYHDGYYEHIIRYNSYKEMINSMMKANDWTLTEAREVAKRECRKECPPFTPEKQLELLKICFDKYERLEKVRGLKEICIIYHHFGSNGYKEFVNCETWEETIAGLINNLWKDLTEDERSEIYGILRT